MDTVKAEIIKDSLKSIIRNSIWLISICLVFILSSNCNCCKISLLGVSVDKIVAGKILIAICFIITFFCFKNYDSILAIFSKLEDNNRTSVRFFLNKHSHLINPFSDPNSNTVTKMIDYLGFVIQCTLPLLGFLLGIYVISSSIESEDVIFYGFYFILLGILNFYPLSFSKNEVEAIIPNTFRIKKNISIATVILSVLAYLYIVLQ